MAKPPRNSNPPRAQGAGNVDQTGTKPANAAEASTSQTAEAERANEAARAGAKSEVEKETQANADENDGTAEGTAQRQPQPGRDRGPGLVDPATPPTPKAAQPESVQKLGAANDPNARPLSVPMSSANEDWRGSFPADVQTVTVTVPKPFRLQVRPGHILKIKEGIQELPLEVAEHSYAKQNGVQVYAKT